MLSEWLKSVIPTTGEVEAGGSQVQGLPQQLSETLPQNFKRKMRTAGIALVEHLITEREEGMKGRSRRDNSSKTDKQL